MGNELPEYFKCPISLEIMVDPVILSSGHTFDRNSIQRWLDSGHRTCPITKLPLPNHPPLLIPNHALRSLISNYAPPSTQLSPLRGSLPISMPHLGRLIATLASRSSTAVEKLEAITHLLSVSKAHPAEFRARATDSGGLSAVLGCIGPDSDPVLQEKALSLLLNLSLDSDDNKVGLVAEGAVEKLTAALVGPAAATAATVITSLAVVEVNKAAIGAHPGAIRGLVTLMAGGKGTREKKEAATALFTLCSFPENRRRAVDCGAVRVLVSMAKTGVERAVEVMGMLAKCKQGREELIRCEEVVGVLVGFVKNGSPRGVQYGLMTLNLICCCSEKVKGEAKRFGVLDMCFGFMGEDQNEKIHRVASNLAKVLQEN